MFAREETRIWKLVRKVPGLEESFTERNVDESYFLTSRLKSSSNLSFISVSDIVRHLVCFKSVLKQSFLHHALVWVSDVL